MVPDGRGSCGNEVSSSSVQRVRSSSEVTPLCSSISASPSPAPGTTETASANQRASSRIFASLLMSIFQPVSWTARRTFCPLRPIASESWSSGTITSIDL